MYMQKLCCKFLVLWFLGPLKITCTYIGILHFIKIFSYRKEKLLCLVAMVAKVMDDNKLKTSLKKWIHIVSNFIDLIQFHFVSNVGEIFWGWIWEDHI